MKPIKIISDYFSDETLRKSFNDLAIETFGLDFEPWYQSKAYCKRYIPFAIVQNNKVIANVSINKITLVINKKLKSALQIGTVMTDKKHRNNGYSKQLMEHILSTFEEKYDLIFLFANDTVLDFYPKFGFQRVNEHSYTIDAAHVNRQNATIEVLNATGNQTKWLINKLAQNRKPVSSVLGAINDKWPLMPYIYSNNWERYFLVDDDIIVLGTHTDGVYHIYDVISNRKVRIDDIINKTTREDDKTIELHFVPDASRFKIKNEDLINDNDALFIRSKEQFSNDFLFPKTLRT